MNLIREASDRLVFQGMAAHMGVILNVAHVHAGKEYLALVIPKLARLIELVHLSDNDGTLAHHYSPGKGNIDFPAVLRSLFTQRFRRSPGGRYIRCHQHP